MGKWMLLILGILAGLFCYGCCKVAGEADAQMEEIKREMDK